MGEVRTGVDSAPAVSGNYERDDASVPVEYQSKNPGGMTTCTNERNSPNVSSRNGRGVREDDERDLKSCEGKKSGQSNRGQSASQDQRSRGQGPSGRRRDLSGMFAWSK